MTFRVMWFRLKIRICLWLLDSLHPSVTYWTNARGGDGFDEVEREGHVHLVTLDFQGVGWDYELFRSVRANRTG